jgi:RNA polymerase sigma factor (sigma-70 family)
MRAVPVPARAPARPLRSRRLLALAGDERLVDQVRRGNEAAFEVIFERHGPAILAFCRHMLASPEEAEDAVQHTFAAAFRDLGRSREREVALKPWLFAIARNRCISVLRARREQPVADPEQVATTGLAEQVEQRAELRRLLADVGDLPEDQRAALLLSELGDMSHAEVGSVLGCEAGRVKALVFRARSGLIARREAREAPCEVIREQLANLRGGALRRTELRLHLRECPGCRAYRDQVKRQRQMLAAALPVAPTLGLKSSVLAAVGLGGGSAGGLTAAAGVFGGATVAKVAVVTALAGGGVVAGDAVVSSGGREAAPPASDSAGVASGARVNDGGQGVGAADHVGAAPAAGDRDTPASEGRRSGVGRFMDPDGVIKRPTPRRGERPAVPPGKAKAKQGRRRGHERKAAEDKPDRGRGPIEAPPGTTPVKRGPPEKQPKPEPPQRPTAETAPKQEAKTKAAPPVAPPATPPPEVPVTEPPKGNGKTK